MFGLKLKVTDGLLYMTHDMVEDLLSNAEQQLSLLTPDKKKEIVDAVGTIQYYKHELANFEKDIEEQRQQLLQFSVEELYNMYGQYDKFINIEFHKFSEAAKKYKREIGGIITYGRKEREQLQEVITSDIIPRSNGFVKIDVALNYGLTEEQIHELLNVGFQSGDIYEVLASNTQLVNSYASKGKKEIPHTLNININPNKTNVCRLAIYSMNLRLNSGGMLIKGEWDEYCGYSIYFSPELKEIEFFKQKIFLANGSMKSEVRFYELVAKNYNSNIKEDELNEFDELLKVRKLQRFEILETELTKTGINLLEKFKVVHPKIYEEIYKVALVFKDEVLNFHYPPIPIYLDFRAYLHIYLRHCEELQPDGHFKGKTVFSYKYDDIRRVLKIAIEKLQDRIQDKLSMGLDFRVYGERTLYFNGNYYSMRIEKNGRVDSFHPNEAI